MQIQLPSGKLLLNVEQSDLDVSDICGFACRQNPKRGFLFVSKVLGKHYPVMPSKMAEIYDILAQKVENILSINDRALFLGFAETATGLGSGVYHHFNHDDSYFIHTTRYHFSDKRVLFNFQEEHSHATGHIVYHPDDKDFQLGNYNTLVLIDDEMTTGKTMSNFIQEFVQLENTQVKKVILVCIKNWMSQESMEAITSRFPHLQVEFVHILKGQYSFIKDESFIVETMPNVDGNSLDKSHLVKNNYGRFGIQKFKNFDYSSIYNQINSQMKTLVLGTGEFSFYPFLLAQDLEQKGVDVVYQSTTRSPIMIGHDIEHKLIFKDNYEDDIVNFVYNVTKEKYEQIVICYETENTNLFNLHETLNSHNVFFSSLKEKQ